MGRGKTVGSTRSSRKLQPAFSPEAAENQGISLAFELVLERLRNGTATSQETTHFLKLGSSKAQLEKEKLRGENELLKAKVEALQAAKNLEEKYDAAMRAMKRYNGDFSDEDYDDYVEFDEFDD